MLTAMQTCGLYSSPSSPTENAAVSMLSDTAFLSAYIKTNQEHLSRAHAHAVNTLRRRGIEHMLGANAAFFLWLNLGKRFLENAQGKRLPEGEVIGIEQANRITQIIYGWSMQRKVFLVLGGAAGAEEP